MIGDHTRSFVDAFVGCMAWAGLREIDMRDGTTTRALVGTVSTIDERASASISAGDVAAARPWIEIGNELRPTATGGMGPWMRALAATRYVVTDERGVVSIPTGTRDRIDPLDPMTAAAMDMVATYAKAVGTDGA